MGHEVSRKVKILVATGARADYGHLRPLFKLLLDTPAFEPTLLVTGSHTLPQFGASLDEIRNDRFPIATIMPLQHSDDTPSGIASAMSVILSAAPNALTAAGAGALIVYGDRWEMLALSIAATLSGIPLVHIGGGDTTEGAYDEVFRHSITKMGHLHFPTSEGARRRILQLGEDPACVFNVGSLAVDALQSVETLPRSEFSKVTGYHFCSKNLLITFHPETVGSSSNKDTEEFLGALSDVSSDYGMLVTLPGLDTGTIFIHQAFQEFVAGRPNAMISSSLGHRNYISALSLFDVLVGNSSSGIYEAPSLGIRTVNIGNRQRGRECAASIQSVACERNEIATAIDSALQGGRVTVENPYGNGDSAAQIRDILLDWLPSERSLRKPFFYIP